MKCTKCGSAEGPFKSGYWSASRGQVIAEDELLCETCAEKRGVFSLRKEHDAQELLEQFAHYDDRFRYRYRFNVLGIGRFEANDPRELKELIMREI